MPTWPRLLSAGGYQKPNGWKGTRLHDGDLTMLQPHHGREKLSANRVTLFVTTSKNQPEERKRKKKKKKPGTFLLLVAVAIPRYLR
jgi:hypothetical protein